MAIGVLAIGVAWLLLRSREGDLSSFARFLLKTVIVIAALVMLAHYHLIRFQPLIQLMELSASIIGVIFITARIDRAGPRPQLRSLEGSPLYWTTGSHPAIEHRRKIGSGGFGEVHEVPFRARHQLILRCLTYEQT